MYTIWFSQMPIKKVVSQQPVNDVSHCAGRYILVHRFLQDEVCSCAVKFWVVVPN